MAPIRLSFLSRAAGALACLLTAAACAAAEPPAWASASGNDAHGTWADLTVKGVTQRFRLLPAGRFAMGSETGDPDQKPVRNVSFALPFWLADTETTQELWIAVMGSNPSYRTIEQTGNARLPVENASYDDCLRFVATLNAAVPDLRASLPSEAQWEYACRAGGAEAPADLDAVAWTLANADRETKPVATRAPNAWGLYDMLGNIEELCHDWYGVYMRDFPGGDERDPRGPLEGVWRSARGGHCGSPAERVGPAVRGTAVPYMGRDSTGLRLAIAGRAPLE
jgi:formylglycine-generating enzyme required for sulfatase activity